ncbi:MAG: xylulokinase [Anaerolineae bacterium]|jgi:xylulokinase|nr:xylulokinase [Anaerolineae bacterium]
MTGLLLGIDIGTSNIKAVVTTAQAQPLAEAHTSYATQFPQPGRAEQNPADWWAGTVQVVRQALAAGPVRPQDIAAIGVSGQGCAVTLLDAAGQVIRPAIIWMDARSEPECERLRRCCAAAILARNGKAPAPYNADPVLMWLQTHEPQALARAQVSLTTTGYLNYRLTGEAVLNVSDASILFAFDLAQEDWSDELIAAFGLPRHLYPPVAPCQQVIGTLQPAAAAELGLPAGIPVVAGGEDTSSAGLAIGVVYPGQALLSLGTAGTLYVVQAAPHVSPRLLAFAHVLAGRALLGGSLVAVGGALAWCRQILGETLSYEALSALAATAEPGAGGLLFLPYLSGELQPINDGHARGVFVGLSMSTTRAQMVRAVMEGTAFAIAHNARLAAAVGTPITEMRAVGGPTRSPLWCQMIADASGYPVSALAENVGAPLGNALLAGAGIGLIEDVAALAGARSGTAVLYEPRAAYRERYERLFDIYTGLYPQLAASFAALSQVP